MWKKFASQPTSDADGMDPYRRRHAPNFGTRVDRDLVGPHSNRELGLMLSGKKPLALLDTCFFQEGWKRAVKEQGWTWCHMMAYSGKAEHFVVVAIPGHEFRLRMLDNVYTRCRAKGQMTDLDHAKIGILLGYTKEQIRAFLVKLSTRQAA